MSYTVFARKYRPQTFDQIVGQEHIVKTLKNAIGQNRLAQAYLFVGPRGTGKTTTARIFAKALNCTDGPKADFDPNDPICREIAEGSSMNVLEFDAASNTQVDKIRELIIDNVKYAPTGGARYKVYIVDEVHMLSTSSFNALLKTLEEPPEHVKFVFATTNVEKVPTTIISRCQRFDLTRIPTAQIAAHLLYIARSENPPLQLSATAAETIARGAEGGLRDAESMLDQLVAYCGETIEESDVLNIFGFTAQQTVAELCEFLIAGDTAGALGAIHSQAEAGKDLSRLMSDLIEHLRNLLVVQCDPQGVKDELSAEALTALSEQSTRIPADKLLDLIEHFANAEGRMKWAANKKMHFEIAVIRAIQALSQASLTDVLDTLTALRGGGPLPERTKAPAPRPVAPAAPVKRETPPSAVQAPTAATPAAPAAPATPTPPPAAAVAAPAAVPAPAPAPTPAPVAEIPPPAPAAAKPATPAPDDAPPFDLDPQPAAAPAPRLSLSATVAASLGQTVKRPAAAAPTPTPAPAPAPTPTPKPPEPAVSAPAAAPASATSTAPVSIPDIWPQLVIKVRRDRPLISGWIESGQLVEITGGMAVLAFPPDATLARDACERGNNRTFIETALRDLTGRPIEIKCEIRNDVVLEKVAPTDMKPDAAKDPMEEFKNDPLIQKALAEFKAEIISA